MPADGERSLSLAEWLVLCQPLVEDQREQLLPVADALHGRLAAASGFDRTLALWRYETVSATVRFLDALCARAAAR